METISSPLFKSSSAETECALLNCYWSCIFAACITMGCQMIWDSFEQDVWEEETVINSFSSLFLLPSPLCIPQSHRELRKSHISARNVSNMFIKCTPSCFTTCVLLNVRERENESIRVLFFFSFLEASPSRQWVSG